jgi:hypothetical protein
MGRLRLLRCQRRAGAARVRPAHLPRWALHPRPTSDAACQPPVEAGSDDRGWVGGVKMSKWRRTLEWWHWASASSRVRIASSPLSGSPARNAVMAAALGSGLMGSSIPWSPQGRRRPFFVTWGRRPPSPGLSSTRHWTWPHGWQRQPMRVGWTWVTLVVERDGCWLRLPTLALPSRAEPQCRLVERSGGSADQLGQPLGVEQPAVDDRIDARDQPPLVAQEHNRAWSHFETSRNRGAA